MTPGGRFVLGWGAGPNVEGCLTVEVAPTVSWAIRVEQGDGYTNPDPLRGVLAAETMRFNRERPDGARPIVGVLTEGTAVLGDSAEMRMGPVVMYAGHMAAQNTGQAEIDALGELAARLSEVAGSWVSLVDVDGQMWAVSRLETQTEPYPQLTLVETPDPGWNLRYWAGWLLRGIRGRRIRGER